MKSIFYFRRFTLSLCAFGLVVFCQPVLSYTDAQQALRQRMEASAGEFPLTALGIQLRTEVTLQALYLERDFAPAWHDANNRPTRQALAAVKEIGVIDNDGLLPSDYHYDALRAHYQSVHLSPSVVTPARIVEYDLLLSDAMVSLSQHLLAGKVDPETLSPDWKAQRRHKDLAQVLEDLIEAEDVAVRINELRPKQVRYFRLQKLLAQLRHAQAPEWGPLAVSPIIKPQMRDERLGAIRERLVYWGDLPPENSEAAAAIVDKPLYDESLLTGIQKFQRRHGLEEDGVIGQLTFEALNVSPAAREKQVVNNLERWRWLAEELGDKHVLVNIAGFELKVVEKNQTIMKKPVIVGRDYRRTPVFSDKIRYIVFNPTWTVPTTLAVKDKLPEIRKDPTVIERLGFTIYDRNQTPVDSSSIDWNAVSRRNFPYRLVQAPGPLNALGQVKFMFPNQYDVYLHDTPARELFAKKERAFSSGCVRVSDPLELATWLLSANGLDRAKVDAIVAKGELQTIFLKQPIPVHIEYWTAWIDSRGELHFRNDVYQRDPSLTAALATPLYGP